MAEQQSLIQWLLEQHDDPPDYSSEEAIADQETIEAAISEERAPEFVVPPAEAEAREAESAQGADVLDRKKATSEGIDPEPPQRTEASPAETEGRAAFGGRLAEIVAKSVWSGQPAQVVAPGRLVAQVATAEQTQRMAGQSIEPQAAERPRFTMPRPFVEREKTSGEPATVAARSVQFHIPPDFPVDAMALFTEFDRDVPVTEEGSFDLDHPLPEIRPVDPTPATDELVNRSYGSEVYLDSREDRRVR